MSVDDLPAATDVPGIKGSPGRTVPSTANTGPPRPQTSVLSESEKARSPIAQLFGRDSIYLMVWAIQLLCAALFTPILTRVLGASEFGTVTSANAIMQILFVFAGLGLQVAVQREHAGNKNLPEARRLVGFALTAAVLVSVVAWSTVDLWSRPLGMADETSSLRLAVVWAGSGAVTNISLGLLRSQDRLLAFCTVGLLQSVVAEALSLLLVQVAQSSAETFLWGQVGAQLAATVLGLCLAPPAMFTARDRALLRRALLLALPLIPSGLSTFILATSDRLVVGAFLGSEAVARYQVAYNVAAMPMLLLSVLSSAWMPTFFGLADGPGRRIVLRESRDALYRLMIPVVIGFASGAPIILRVWAPASYRPDELQFVVSLVLVTIIPFAAQLAVTRTLMTEGRTGAIGFAAFLAAVVNVLLNLVLVPSLGLVGSAIATLVAYLFLYAVLAFAGRDASPGSTPRGLQLQLFAVAAIALLAAAVPNTGIVLVLRVLVGLAAVAWFVWAFLKISRKAATEPPPEPGPAPRRASSTTGQTA